MHPAQKFHRHSISDVLSKFLTPESEAHDAKSSCDFVHICLKISAIGSFALRIGKDFPWELEKTSPGILSKPIPLASAYSLISTMVHLYNIYSDHRLLVHDLEHL